MDWKLDRIRREKNQALAKKEASLNVNIMDEMERDFAQIFGEGKRASLSSAHSRKKSFDNSARSPRSAESPKADRAPELD